MWRSIKERVACKVHGLIPAARLGKLAAKFHKDEAKKAAEDDMRRKGEALMAEVSTTIRRLGYRLAQGDGLAHLDCFLTQEAEAVLKRLGYVVTTTDDITFTVRLP